MMKIISNGIASIFMTCCALHGNVVPYLAFRSQGIDGAREIVGWQSQINRYDKDSFYGSFSATPEYTRSFLGQRIAECLFSDALVNDGCCKEYFDVSPACCNSYPHILIQGSKVQQRHPRALLADNFYLPTDFSSQMSFRPRIQNILVDFNLYMGLDNLAKGLYFRIHSPLCNTRWNLHATEKVFDPGTYNYDPGYFNDTYTPAHWDDPSIYGIAREQLLADFTSYVSCGNSIKALPGIQYDGLSKARISTTTRSKTALAEITAAFGWNLLSSACYTLGLNIRAAAPTGTRPHGDWLFEPIVGNGHHWELGAGLNSRMCVWCNETEEEDVTLSIDAYATHLFKSRHCRTFDLNHKPLSRYMLAMNMGTPVDNLLAVENYVSVPPTPAIWTLTTPNAQSKNQFVPLANLTTIPVNVSYAAQGELILTCAYTYYNWQWDFGYDFWGRSCTKISPIKNSCPQKLDSSQWALKGDAFAFGFAGQWNGDVANPVIVNVATQGLPLSATESKATIFEGTNNWPDGIKEPLYGTFVTQPWASNPGIDNFVYAVEAPVGTNPADHLLASKEIGKPGWVPSGTSLQPQFIHTQDLDFKSASTRSISHKLFLHIGHTWRECECWTPYIGIGAMAEFGQRGTECSTRLYGKTCCDTHIHSCQNCVTAINNNNTDHRCAMVRTSSCCVLCSLSQWGAWIKGGISFN